MNVTRDVIYDLLPSYFAGDASADTRALVEAYFETDPEFGRMAARFQSIAGRQRAEGGSPDARERETFACARAAAELPQKTRASALGSGFASLLGFGFALLTWNDRMGMFHPGILLGTAFGVLAVLLYALSFRIKPDSWWREMTGLDNQALTSAGLGRRPGRLFRTRN